MYYSNKEQVNPDFKCVLCNEGEHGVGSEKKQVCFNCIKELVKAHDSIVKPGLRIVKN
nr:hypothetical protein [Paenibacillus xylanexedens]